MEFLTTALLSGLVYDIFKCQAKIGIDSLKQRLQEWVVDDTTVARLSEEIRELNLNEDMSETAIQRHLDSSDTIKELIAEVQPSEQTIINQTHYGKGDNVAGDKIVKG